MSGGEYRGRIEIAKAMREACSSTKEGLPMVPNPRPQTILKQLLKE